MGLLAQLFRHKNAPNGGHESPSDPGAGEVRGIAAIAAAAGVRTAHGMPAEFALPLGEIIARVPEHCVWPGGHDAGRVLRIPASDVAPGLERGKPQLSLARLVALAPEVFRWERGASEAPLVRLPIQKLLQQIRNDDSSPTHIAGAAAHVQPMHSEAAAVGQISTAPVLPSRASAAAADIPVPAVKLQPPGVPEVMPSVSVVATERPERPFELRPSKDVAIATTLRAVVLGGIASGGTANAHAPAGQILAPRVAQTVAAAPSPTVLMPSVIRSPIEAGRTEASRSVPDFAGLQNLFMTDAPLDLAEVASFITKLPGVMACVISGAAGNAVAGDFSHGVTAEEMRNVSDSLPRLGGATSDTVHRGESDIALFLHGEICVAALVSAGGFVHGVRERLTRAAGLLAGAPAAK